MSREASELRRSEAHHRLERELRAGHPCGHEISLVDLVLLACEVSEDEGEVGDVVDGLIDSGAARILPVRCDPMLERIPAPATAA